MAKDSEIGAGDFKAKCLRLIDDVAVSRTELTITKRGRPLAKLVPVDDDAPPVFGCMAGTVTIVGDIVAPVDVEWEAVN